MQSNKKRTKTKKKREKRKEQNGIKLYRSCNAVCLQAKGLWMRLWIRCTRAPRLITRNNKIMRKIEIRRFFAPILTFLPFFHSLSRKRFLEERISSSFAGGPRSAFNPANRWSFTRLEYAYDSLQIPFIDTNRKEGKEDRIMENFERLNREQSVMHRFTTIYVCKYSFRSNLSIDLFVKLTKITLVARQSPRNLIVYRGNFFATTFGAKVTRWKKRGGGRSKRR